MMCKHVTAHAHMAVVLVVAVVDCAVLGLYLCVCREPGPTSGPCQHVLVLGSVCNPMCGQRYCSMSWGPLTGPLIVGGCCISCYCAVHALRMGPECPQTSSVGLQPRRDPCCGTSWLRAYVLRMPVFYQTSWHPVYEPVPRGLQSMRLCCVAGCEGPPALR